MKTDEKNIVIPDFMVVLKKISEGKDKISQIHKDLKITLSHLYNIKSMLVEKGFVEVDGQFRTQKIHVTEKGTEMVECINKMLLMLAITDIDIKKAINQRRYRHRADEIEPKEGVDASLPDIDYLIEKGFLNEDK